VLWSESHKKNRNSHPYLILMCFVSDVLPVTVSCFLHCKGTQKEWENGVDAPTLRSYLTVRGAVSSVPLRPSVRPVLAADTPLLRQFPLSADLLAASALARRYCRCYVYPRRAAGRVAGRGRTPRRWLLGGRAVERGERCRQSLNVRRMSR